MENKQTGDMAVIGAGALGLGFMGVEFSHEATVHFLDIPAKSDLIEKINSEGRCFINMAGPVRSVREVTNITAATVENEEKAAELIADCSLCFTSVGAANLVHIVPLLKRAADLRTDTTPLAVLCAENGEDIALRLSTDIGRTDRIVTSDTTMGRMCMWIDNVDDSEDTPVPLLPGLDCAVVAETFYGIPYLDHDGMPELAYSALQPRNRAQFALDEHIKLFAHNCGHALFAYAAARRGCRLIREIAQNAGIMARAEKMLHGELMPALEKLDGVVFDKADYMNYAVNLVRRIHSPTLNDTVERGIRGAVSKLGNNERWVSAIRFLLRAGVEPVAYCQAMADVMHVADLSSEPERTLADTCRFTGGEIDIIMPIIKTALERKPE